jgi:predicted kinase
MVCGPSGTGKTAIARDLIGVLPGTILLEADILWQAEFNQPDENYRGFFETWLRLAKNISQAGHPVTLFCTGTIPENIEPCVERRYFTKVHYLALTCEPEELAERLRRRPAWRDAGVSQFSQAQVKFNRWIVEKGQYEEPAIRVVDTTRATLADSSGQVAAWIKTRLEEWTLSQPKSRH